MIKKFFSVFLLACCLNIFSANGQNSSDAKMNLAPTPPMGWMTWNFFGTDINENIIREKPEDEFRNTYILEFHELEEYLFDT